MNVDSPNRIDGFTYDAAGNLTNDGTHTYLYDAENRLIQVDAGATAIYTYDAPCAKYKLTTTQPEVKPPN